MEYRAGDRVQLLVGGAVRYAPINFLCNAGVGVGSGAPDILWYPLMVERASFSVPGAYPSLIV